ncbi:MAG: PLP-dependent aspartate aminotransferase family protein [Defluviitaleaceae bacterium]|nr:PLP-dependent aspartate aminotransferase family protein [Defluviitaleaceae bacterium]
MKIDTICVHGMQKQKEDKTGTINMPIYQTAAYSHSEVDKEDPYGYTRLANPTREAAEELVASLENAKYALSFTSGLAAVSSFLDIFNKGDHIILTEDLYGGVISIINNFTTKNGVLVDFIDTSDINGIKSKIKTNTKAIYIETPTNPMMNVTDIKAVAEIIKDLNIILIVDNTFLTPYFQNPLELGADLVVHSGTKYLSGHNDTLAGFLVTNNNELYEEIKTIRGTRGAPLSPMDSFLIIRGIKTLALRMEKAQQNALLIANWLKNNNKVTKVYYIGLKEHMGYNISKKQSRGFGAMISFEVDSKETAYKILLSTKIIIFAESLGGAESLITYPCENTHKEVDKDSREKRGITDKLIRLSVGIENVNDLIKDLEQAF